MKKILILIFLSLSCSVFAQSGEYEDVYSSDVINPKFNGGGLDKFYDFIQGQFNYSKVTKAGQLIVAFTIDKEGNLGNIKVIEFNDIESATEIIRVLDLSPKWESAKRGGKTISIELKIPLKFNLTPKLIPNKNQSVNTNLAINSKKEQEISKLDSYEINTIEKKPEFVGGIQSFYKFIADNYNTPNIKDLKGKILISFVIDQNGNVIEPTVIKDLGYGTGKEALRVLNKCPKWIPGEQNGKTVRVIYSLPLNIDSTRK